MSQRLRTMSDWEFCLSVTERAVDRGGGVSYLLSVDWRRPIHPPTRRRALRYNITCYPARVHR